ncbi:MAG TPA: hypothetical protein VGH85_04810 [Mycobacteriales bacterium]
MNVAVVEHAVERYYATVTQQQITEALATLTTGETVDHDAGGSLDLVQVYRSCTDDRRRLLNQALVRRLYLADDRITADEPWPRHL